MKTSFNIAWIDDNFNDPEMNPASQLERKIKRKNGFSLNTKDVYKDVTEGDINILLSKLAKTIDLSNSFDLIVIDYELGNKIKGQEIASKFRARLPSIDILFYSGKKDAEDLRTLIAAENVDGVNCVGRQNLVEGTYTVIENIINRSYKISTLRGLILNSVCEMDHMIREIIIKYSAVDTTKLNEVKNKTVDLIKPKGNLEQKTNLKNKSVTELLNDKSMMSGRLFSVVEKIQNSLTLSDAQQTLLNTFRVEILDLRTTAAHAKEAICQTTGQSMLKFKNVEYKRGDIDSICKKIVEHENSILSILNSMS
jgi:hypothetical protein